MAVAVSSAI